MMNKHYKYGEWQIEEHCLDFDFLNKTESIFTQGNGYITVRGTFEEMNYGEQRNSFVSGTFNITQGENEVPELPNFADFTNCEIYIDDIRMQMNPNNVSNYTRSLNLKNGELRRSFTWESFDGKKYDISFKRFVSLKDRHLFCSSVEIKSDHDCNVKIIRSIDGKMNNHGVQHFREGTMKFVDKKIAHLNQHTTQSDIQFSINMVSKAFLNCDYMESFPTMKIGRRDMISQYEFDIRGNQTLRLETYANVYTSRDNDIETSDIENIGIEAIRETENLNYNQHLSFSSELWNFFWDKHDVKIESNDGFYQTNIRFVLYHLRLMTPVYDNRMGIGAKGFTGEDYKGHSFWDTEIYIMPFWIMSDQNIARQLIEYRGHLLKGAREKAKENGYSGAMYPWEAAWIEDSECTPKWGNIDAITNEREPIWTGFKQIHITADVIYSLWMYCQMRGDYELLNKIGYEMILETAKFWSSRLEYSEKKDRYEINDVIGPDEYKEHINNNAFTNYMCAWNMQLAIDLIESEKISSDVYDSQSIFLSDLKEKIKKIYLPKVNENGIIPQDDTYLKLDEFPELERFKYKEKALAIFKEYSMVQLSEYRLGKQADVIMLFLLLEDMFTEDVKLKNFEFYEKRCLHDSSLSYSMYALAASRLSLDSKFKELFEKAIRIDLNQESSSSKTGVHAAAIGGIWQDYALGMVGISYYDGELNIEPKLIDEIKSIELKVEYQKQLLSLLVSNDEVTVKVLDGNEDANIKIYGKEYKVNSTVTVQMEI